MQSRFEGPDGRARLVTALTAHVAISGNRLLAERLADACQLRTYKPGSDLIVQGANDSSVFFLLSGTCEVYVNDRLVAERTSGCHVGEMAAIDPSARRSATVRARDEVVAAIVSDVDIESLGGEYPELYRCFATELARRLRQRADHVRPANGRPRVFIGSSVEGLSVARALQRALEYDAFDVIVWTDNVVKPGEHVCDALLAEVRKTDFAVFHTSADDRTWSRRKVFTAPRDNVLFELGMFMGVLEKERAFLLMPRGHDVKIPTDLLGITPLTYDPPSDPDLLQSRLGPVAECIREAVSRLGPA